jgi:hypothetical protein
MGSMDELSLETGEIQLHIFGFHQITPKVDEIPQRLPHKGYFDAPSSAPPRHVHSRTLTLSTGDGALAGLKNEKPQDECLGVFRWISNQGDQYGQITITA